MKSTLSSTEVARRLGDILAEVKHAGHTLVITRNGEPVAELRPVTPKRCSLGQLAAFWDKFETDDAFARDLEKINRSDLPGRNPWA